MGFSGQRLELFDGGGPGGARLKGFNTAETTHSTAPFGRVGLDEEMLFSSHVIIYFIQCVVHISVWEDRTPTGNGSHYLVSDTAFFAW